MLIFTPKGVEIDPNYLSIMPLRLLYESAPDKETATALLSYVYHMENPRSPYESHKDSQRGNAIIKACFPPHFQSRDVYDPDKDIYMQGALEAYRKIIQVTPLRYAARSLQQAIYQFSDVLTDPTKSPQEKKIATEQLDALPAKYEKMRLQAEKHEISLEVVKGDRDISDWERQ